MATADLQRDLGRLEGKVDAVVSGISDVKTLVATLQKSERDERAALEDRLTDRYDELHKRVSASEKRSYVLHGIGLAFMFFITQMIDMKAALSTILGKG